MQFRQLATDRHRAPRQHFGDGRKCHHQPIRAFVEHERCIQAAQLFQHRALLGRLAREEAAEVEARAHRSRGHVGAGRRRGAGQHLHGHAGFARRGHKSQPRIGYAGHAGVRAISYHLAGGHSFHHTRSPRADHRLVQPHEPLLNPEMREQLPRHPGVLRTHHIGLAQRLKRAQRHIAQVPNGRRHDDEFPRSVGRFHYSTTSVVSTSTEAAMASGSSGAPSRATARAARASASFSAKFALATAIMSLMRLSWFTSLAPGS